MKFSKFSAISLFLIMSILPGAQVKADPFWDQLAGNPKDRIFTIYKQLNKLYRPSGEEEATRKFIRDLAERAGSKFWNRPLKIEQDAAGNMSILVPGTGAFADAPSVALQSHLDMVLKTNDKNDNLKARFANGVDLVETDGKLHSRNFTTTQGADNGIGVAQELVYLVSPDLPHPPLELIFTVEEECGLIGAEKFGLPMHSRMLINLDWDDCNTICHGCMGADHVYADGDLALTQTPAQAQRLTLKVEGFPGGHSGVDIHRDRPSAVMISARIMSALEAAGIQFWMVSAQSGTRGVLNVVPTDVELNFVVPSDKVSGAWEVLHAAIVAQQNKLSAVNAAKAQFTLEHTTGLPPKLVVEAQASVKIFKLLASLHDGVVLRDPEYLNGIRTSSNLGFLELKENKLALGYMLRSFAEADLKSFSDTNKSLITEQWPGTAPLVRTVSFSAPWVQPKARLFDLVHQAHPTATPSMAAGSLEAAILSRKFPQVEVVSIGPTISAMHMPEESVEVASIYRMQETLQKALENIGGCEAILKAGGNDTLLSGTGGQ